ncbi:GGDEF and EAL domain proteins [Vibrio maritimus]|uniref:GGDEF and EAL domain proteins n=1 Tax=Vibrio maritimus TaxID=990268 RepID=A0A090RZM4_9VIBR|nr:GGDEF and EAL domain proteins [Vibrio maritimus]
MEIISHPGEAYSQLWSAFERLSAAFLGIFALGLLSIAFILRRALNPLRAIVQKMEQVANRQFGEPLLRPKTKDLIAVVDGINSMSAHVEESFKQQAKEAQKLRERAYMDLFRTLETVHFSWVNSTSGCLNLHWVVLRFSMQSLSSKPIKLTVTRLVMV